MSCDGKDFWIVGLFMVGDSVIKRPRIKNKT